MHIWNRKWRGLTALTIALMGAASMASLSLAADAPAAPVAVEELNAPAQVSNAVAQAEIQRKAGNLTGAMKTLSQLVLAAPDDARVLGSYGKTMVAQGRADDALAFLERAIELQPNDWTLYSAQGIAYDQKGNYKSAQTSYARSLVLKPGEPTVLSNAALSHMQAGDLDGAENLLLQAQPNGAAYPRIAQNLAMVQGLKAHLLAVKAATPAPAVETAAAKPASAPAPAAAAVAKPIIPAPAPIASAPLPPPAPKPAQQAAPAPSASKPPAQLSGLAGLMADPSVRVQALPKDDQAGKAQASPAKPQAKTTGTEEKLAAAKPASDGLSLRPAVSDTDKRKPAPAKQ